MNFSGMSSSIIERFSSVVEQEDSTNLPLGVSPAAQNITYALTGFRTRDGLQSKYGVSTGTSLPITGLFSLKTGTESTNLLLFDKGGNLGKENPSGTGVTSSISSGSVVPPANAFMQAAGAFDRAFIAFSDLKVNAQGNAVYDLANGWFDPLSMLPSGSTYLPVPSAPILVKLSNSGNAIPNLSDVWVKVTLVNAAGETLASSSSRVNFGSTETLNAVRVMSPQVSASLLALPAPYTPTSYKVYAGIVPTGGPEPIYKLQGTTTLGSKFDFGAIAAGAAPPTSSSITNPLVLTNVLPAPVAPTISRLTSAGSFAAGRDVYIAVSFVNGMGETLTSSSSVFVNTSLNDGFHVNSPAPPSWASSLPVPYTATSYNVYEADVATGAAAPTTLKLVGSVAIGTDASVGATATGASNPIANNARVTPIGNICAGLRYAVVLFQTRTGYISGMTDAAVVSVNVDQAGHQLYGAQIPLGPANTAKRIVAFTVAGGTQAGAFFYIDSSDNVDGVVQSSTVINDNTTTSAFFTFTDDYLKDASDVTSFFRKIQIPNATDVFYARSLQRMVYQCPSDPSAFLVSLQRDPESVYGDTGRLALAENNGERAICWREMNGVQYAFKENSAYRVASSTSDPSLWDATELWTGIGPCGVRAIDVAAKFLIFVHRSGAYVYFGSDTPELLSKDIPKTWARINWSVGHLISVNIDEETREVRICVPLDGASVPSHTLKINYEESPLFEPPVHSSAYSRGKFVATAAARKWSLDTIAAFQYVRAKRSITPDPSDNTPVGFAVSQLLVASSITGSIPAITPNVYNDDGQPIPWLYETASPGEMNRINQLGGASFNATGNGNLLVEILAGRDATAVAHKVVTLSRNNSQDYYFGGRGQNERYRLRFSGNTANEWAGVKTCVLWTRNLFSARQR